MTNPTITYGHAYLVDSFNGAGTTWAWGGYNVPPGDKTIAILHDDWLDLGVTFDQTLDEYSYVETPGISASTNLYPTAIIRWKTGVSSNGAGARVQAYFSDTTTQDLLDIAGTPQFSTLWMVTIATLTPNKVLDCLRFFADDYPNSLSSGTYHTYFDFALICRGQFTFPNVGHRLRFSTPPRYVDQEMINRVTDNTQPMGAASSTVLLDCDFNIGNWKRTADATDGQIFMDISHNAKAEAFQWLTFDKGCFKVTLRDPDFILEGTNHQLTCGFKEYSRCSASNYSYTERFGLNLI
jgi:hypothetical protein